MFKLSSWLHLRIPFSFFLLPVFLFALSVSPNINQSRLVVVFLILHFFLYPASNGYNSYFDKDEESIGGLKNPPKVTPGLYYLALLFDLIALVLGYYMINFHFMAMLFVYGMVSKAYSHPMVRLKKYAYLGWFVTGLFQGAFTFQMAYIGLNDYHWDSLLKVSLLIPALLTSLMLWGSYPMTQIYQHKEDRHRGDITLSIKLGIIGTFHFTAVAFMLATIGFVIYFNAYHNAKYSYIFLASMLPVVVYFGAWYIRAWKNPDKANFTSTMRLNMISAVCLSAFFIYFFLDNSQLLQAIQGGY